MSAPAPTPPSSPSPFRLLLFDIDGTLLDTGGAGRAAILDAFEIVFSIPEAGVPPLDFSGATDSGLIREWFEALKIELSPENCGRFQDAYHDRLRERLATSHSAGTLLPGTIALLEQLSAHPGTILALLTGNTRVGATIKLEHYGIDHHFETGAFGDDHHDRNALGPIAIERVKDGHGHAFESHEVIVIGDTPKDIHCARACGAVAVAVATGMIALDELATHDPDHLFENFTDRAAVLETLLG